MSRQEQSHSDGPENNSCQKIEITDSKKIPYNHDNSEDVERRYNTMKRPINWVHMSTFDCLNKTKRHCSLINLIVMIISDWLTLADKALINALLKDDLYYRQRCIFNLNFSDGLSLG